MGKFILIDEQEHRALIMDCLKQFHEEYLNREKEKAPEENEEKIRGIRGLAEYLQCSIATAQKIKKTKDFPFYQVQRLVYFKKSSIDKFFQTNPKPNKR